MQHVSTHVYTMFVSSDLHVLCIGNDYRLCLRYVSHVVLIVRWHWCNMSIYVWVFSCFESLWPFQLQPLALVCLTKIHMGVPGGVLHFETHGATWNTHHVRHLNIKHISIFTKYEAVWFRMRCSYWNQVFTLSDADLFTSLVRLSVFEPETLFSSASVQFMQFGTF